MRALTERETFIDLERGIEDFLMADLRPASSHGLRPGAGLCLRAGEDRREFLLVRIVVSGKINGLPAALIRERISDTYV